MENMMVYESFSSFQDESSSHLISSHEADFLLAPTCSLTNAATVALCARESRQPSASESRSIAQPHQLHRRCQQMRRVKQKRMKTSEEKVCTVRLSLSRFIFIHTQIHDTNVQQPSRALCAHINRASKKEDEDETFVSLTCV